MKNSNTDDKTKPGLLFLGLGLLLPNTRDTHHRDVTIEDLEIEMNGLTLAVPTQKIYFLVKILNALGILKSTTVNTSHD